jgi:opacity protein-like surface antigen
MFNVFTQFMKSAVSLSLVIMLFSASSSYAKAPSNEELHQMIMGMKDKLDKLEVANQGLKKQLGVALNKIEGRTYASLDPQHSNGVVPASARRDLSPIKAVARNVKQVPQVSKNGGKHELAMRTQTERTPSKYYAALNLEYTIPENVTVESGGNTGDASLADGIGFGLAIGHRYNDKFRAEIELSRRSFELQNITPTSGGNARTLSGQLDIYAAMINGYYDITDQANLYFKNAAFRPYIGAGIGPAYLVANDVAASLNPTNVILDRQTTVPNTASIWLPAGQLMAGLSFPMTNVFEIDIGYKYLLMGDITGTVDGASGDSSVLRSHSLKLGMRYNLN